MANIFDYTDIRSFLQDSFDEAKAKNPRWSLRSWALKLKLSGPSGLAMVLNGQRNAGTQLAEKLADYFKLKPTERDYFLSLAKLGTGASSSALISMLKPASGKAIANEKDLPHDTVLPYRWYFYAIREMTLLSGFKPDAEWIAARLRHRVSRLEIKAALESLVRQGFLVETAGGKLRPAPGRFEGGGSSTAALFNRFQTEILELGRHALERDNPDARGFFSSTFTISKDDLPAAKEAIRKFRSEFERLFEKENADTTVQLNVQLFSVADSEPNRSKS